MCKFVFKAAADKKPCLSIYVGAFLHTFFPNEKLNDQSQCNCQNMKLLLHSTQFENLILKLQPIAHVLLRGHLNRLIFTIHKSVKQS